MPNGSAITGRSHTLARPAIRNRKPGSGRFLYLLPALVSCGLLAFATGLFVPSASSQSSFANDAFKTEWDRSDGLVASGVVLRPWVWGPAPGPSLTEPFGGLPGNSHAVQYFDKGRMEINDPNANKSDPNYVSNGRLAIELISGMVQTGITSFERRSPAAIDLASDADDPTAPTYQSFNGVASIPGAPNERRSTDQTGQLVRTAIDRQGNTQPWPKDRPDYDVRLAHFEDTTGHNIPDVFWAYLNQQTDIVQDGQQVKGPLFDPWFLVTGYPISEPYWSYVKVDGQYTDVLIQAYERRVLTFVPHLATPFKVQMGNIGQHYYQWRYETVVGPTPQVPVPGATPTVSTLPPLPNLTIDSIGYGSNVVDINANLCTITNRGQSAQSLDGWWLDSPKWDHVDRFYFPGGITVQPGASINVHSGTGENTTTDIFMARYEVMWDGQPYDYAVLYDNYGRQVSDFFPAADKGVPPTPPPRQASRRSHPRVRQSLNLQYHSRCRPSPRPLHQPHPQSACLRRRGPSPPRRLPVLLLPRMKRLRPLRPSQPRSLQRLPYRVVIVLRHLSSADLKMGAGRSRQHQAVSHKQ